MGRVVMAHGNRIGLTTGALLAHLGAREGRSRPQVESVRGPTNLFLSYFIALRIYFCNLSAIPKFTGDGGRGARDVALRRRTVPATCTRSPHTMTRCTRFNVIAAVRDVTITHFIHAKAIGERVGALQIKAQPRDSLHSSTPPSTKAQHVNSDKPNQTLHPLIFRFF